MGDKLVKYYDYAKQRGGRALQMKLALKTGISSISAASSPDSPDTLDRFHSTISNLLEDTSVPRF